MHFIKALVSLSRNALLCYDARRPQHASGTEAASNTNTHIHNVIITFAVFGEYMFLI